jgi:hypothetical protein
MSVVPHYFNRFLSTDKPSLTVSGLSVYVVANFKVNHYLYDNATGALTFQSAVTPATTRK